MSSPARLSAPVDLTLASAGSRTVRHLLSLVLLRARAVASSLASADPLDPRHALRRALPPDPGLLLASLRRPSRLTLARCLELSPHAPAAARTSWARSLAASLLLDAAEVGALVGEVTLSADSLLISERSGWALQPPPGAHLVLAPHRLTLRASGVEASSPLPVEVDALAAHLAPAGAEVRRAHVRLWHDTSLLLVDTNPLAEQEAHPAKHGNRVDLGDRAPDEWVAPLRDALSLIERVLPEIADEMRLLLGHVGPVGYFAQEHLSASYLEATGVVYLSLHPHAMTLVEALVHEFQHNKLNLLLGLDPTLTNADAPLFTSPVRPDPRPLRGVLLAVHAFQPLVRLYERLLTMPASGEGEAAWRRRRLGEVARMCHEGCEVLLPNARPTPVGASLLAEIARLDREFTPHLAAS